MKVFLLRIKELLYKILKKDPMKIKIQRYRVYGAKIGDNVRAFSPISSAESYLISVGSNTTISTGVKFLTHDNSACKLYDDATDFVGRISIGENCFIGANVILLPGVTIANNCIIGAGSVVTKSVLEEGIVLAGNPAKKICAVEELKSKNNDFKFNFRGVDKKKEILSNENKFLKR